VNIRRIALVFSLLGAGAMLPLQGAACVAGTAADYVSLGATGCTIGTWTFSNFSYGTTVNGGGSVPNATQNVITPLLGNGAGFSFTPTVPWTNSAGISDIELQYIVSFTGNITSIYQSITGSVVPNPSAGFLNITDVYCPGGTTLPPGGPCDNPGPVPVLFTNVFSGTPGGFSANSANFAAVSSVAVLKDVSANAQGFPGSTSTITQFTNCFNGDCSVVPEPGTYGLALMGFGLLALRAIKFRRRSA